MSVIHRLETRTASRYGKDADELVETLGYIETVEPRLRRGADHEIDTSAPLDDVLTRMLALIGD